MPFETKDYVLAITGHDVEEWRGELLPSSAAPDPAELPPGLDRKAARRTRSSGLARRFGPLCALGRAGLRQLLQGLRAARLRPRRLTRLRKRHRPHDPVRSRLSLAKPRLATVLSRAPARADRQRSKKTLRSHSGRGLPLCRAPELTAFPVERSGIVEKAEAEQFSRVTRQSAGAAMAASRANWERSDARADAALSAVDFRPHRACRPPSRRRGGGLQPPRGLAPPHQLRGSRAPHPPACAGAAEARRRLGDRVATLAWNSYRHLELYYAVSGMGAVCHTVNPRLSPDQIVYIINHAGIARALRRPHLRARWRAIAPHRANPASGRGAADRRGRTCPTSRCPPACALSATKTLIAAADDDFVWPEFDESTAASLCYTSGTTGRPERRALQPSLDGAARLRGRHGRTCSACAPPTACCRSCRCSTSTPGACRIARRWSGAKLVMPGRHLDGASLHELFEAERVTFTAGVPTVWLGLLQHLRDSGEQLDTLKRIADRRLGLPAGADRGIRRASTASRSCMAGA